MPKFRMPLRKAFENHASDTVLNAMVSESENSNVSRYFKLLLWLVLLLIGCLLKYIPIFLEKIIEIQPQKIGDEAEKKSKLLSRMLSYAVSNYEQRNRL